MIIETSCRVRCTNCRAWSPAVVVADSHETLAMATAIQLAPEGSGWVFVWSQGDAFCPVCADRLDYR